MKSLNVETQNTSMGFSYTNDNDFEYSGNSINSLFAKKTNELLKNARRARCLALGGFN